MSNEERDAPCYLHAVVNVKPDRLDEFSGLMVELRRMLHETYGVRLERSYRSISKHVTFVNLWAVPSGAVLEQIMKASAEEPLIHRVEACIESEQVEVVCAVECDE
ncbi:hypothetical protein WMF45_19050 [Sorangium sp. So ce448]|uniref:hypothetical protein n=1 Tax=Sorangium sp. So ce448 TaxID=3133314 RepID=UPI003F5DAB71